MRVAKRMVAESFVKAAKAEREKRILAAWLRQSARARAYGSD